MAAGRSVTSLFAQGSPRRLLARVETARTDFLVESTTTLAGLLLFNPHTLRRVRSCCTSRSRAAYGTLLAEAAAVLWLLPLPPSCSPYYLLSISSL